MRTASSLNQRKNSAAYAASARASLKTLPFSRVINRAKDSCSAIIISKLLRNISARTRGAVAFHELNALCAASTADKQSSGVALETCASVEPSTGFITATFELWATHLPAIKESSGCDALIFDDLFFILFSLTHQRLHLETLDLSGE